MSDVTDSRLYLGVQKLKGFVKLCQDAEGKLQYVKTQAGEIAETQKKLRESIPNGAKVSAPAPRQRGHLTLVK